MKKSQFGFLSSVLVMVLSLFAQSASAERSDQFRPGQEHFGVDGRGATMGTLRQVSPGKAMLAFEGGLYAVFLNVVPSQITPDQISFSGPDETGKGTAHVVDIARSPYLAAMDFCVKGAGHDWNKESCSPIVGNRAEVLIDVGNIRSQAFALIPVLMDGKREHQWVAHPKNTKVVIGCPGMDHPDMASLFFVNKAGVISIVNEMKNGEAILKEYATKRYPKFCRR